MGTQRRCPRLLGVEEAESEPGSAPAKPGLAAPVPGSERRRLVDFASPQIQQLGLLVGSLVAVPPSAAAYAATFYRFASVVPLPSVDWRSAALTPVRDQGQCASCWALASADLVSLLAAIVGADGTAEALSAQQLCDCEAGATCCQGGWPAFALQYIVANGGLDSDADYPYTGANETCDSGKEAASKVAGITSWETVPAQDTFAMMKAVTKQPVLALMNGDAPDFQSLGAGFNVYAGSCSDDRLNHAVLIMGYDSLASPPYWIVKNSWGTDWADAGYAYIAMESGKGRCGITSSPGLIGVSNDPANACAGVNPCGDGTCTPVAGGYTCACPSGYVNNFVSGSLAPKCVPASPCSANPNPCGYGACNDNNDGSYLCTCPANTALGSAADGSPTCVAGHKTGGLPTYQTVVGDTCKSVAQLFSISVADLKAYNPSLVCQQLQKGTVLAVAGDQLTGSCTAHYITRMWDTCGSIARSRGITVSSLMRFNPSLNCYTFFLWPGQSLCTNLLTVTSPPPPACTQSFQVTKAYSTCASIMGRFQLSLSEFQAFNPSINCFWRLPRSLSVCVAQSPAITAAAPACTNKYLVTQGDTCGMIALASDLSESQFMDLNPGLQCGSPFLQIGQEVCIAPPNSTDYMHIQPYITKAGETLANISQAMAQRCGPTASPANICFQNQLSDCNNVAANTLLEIPCQWPIGRYCGCTDGDDVCGWDGKIYNSLCDAICNFATPTYAPTNGQCNPCATACHGHCFGNPDVLSPLYCQLSDYWNPCPYPPFPPLSYSCNDYLMECQKCCWWLGYGSFAFNSCFSDCRQDKPPQMRPGCVALQKAEQSELGRWGHCTDWEQEDEPDPLPWPRSGLGLGGSAALPPAAMAPLAALLVLMAAAVAARASSAASAVAGPSLLELVTDVHARRAPVDFQSPDLRRLGRLRTRPPSLLVAPEASDGFRYASVNAPPSWDWRLAPTRALTAVKSQEAGCADCWAVVTADAVSSARAIAEAREVDDVSPESLHVCQGRECCTGGWPELALEAITTANTTSQLAAWEITPARNALALMQAIFVQPVIAYVSSSNPAFASYTGGILSTSDCPAGELDHALLVVGYAADVTEPYWVVKNSWGPEWGEAGYAKLAMTDGDGTCGMLSMPALMPIHLPARGSCLSANKLCGGGSCITLESQEAYTCNCPLGFVLDATNAAAPKCVPTKSDVQALDAPSSADGPVTENVIEHVIREGETLDSIAQLLVQLCGPVASPENILFFNDGAPYSTGMTLRIFWPTKSWLQLTRGLMAARPSEVHVALCLTTNVAEAVMEDVAEAVMEESVATEEDSIVLVLMDVMTAVLEDVAQELLSLVKENFDS
eukprot:SM000144S00706  [mRNA]  locus=s144:260589:284227:- [translate_table: standard]